jgi:DNA modification methylase
MGSGTTAVAAIQNDREYVGFEIDEENYRDVIERRIGEAKRQRDASVNADSDT